MTRLKMKEFRDPVHGYISVPSEYCDSFIDTPIFQRLRHVEQTSMRPLYPSAHHERFSHSLGTFHLARIAFSHLKTNTESAVLDSADIERYQQPVEIAALMHDCAHAPFSHLFEPYYAREDRHTRFLFDQVSGIAFKEDYTELCKTDRKPAPHEVFSAAVFLRHFRTVFTNACPNCDPLLVARMIMGCVHRVPAGQQDQLENCLIRLINGPAIDVDKLDYILRDTWSSGVDNVSIDVERLLSSLMIVPGPRDLLELAFRKSALSVVQSVIDGRNFLYRWIYAHHTVNYCGNLLTQAIERLNTIIPNFLSTVFSAEVFEQAIPLKEGISVYLPCDHDIFTLLKFHRLQIPEVDELLGRKPRFIPIWKTEAEFEIIFEKNRQPEMRTSIRNALPSILKDVLGDDCEIVRLQVKPRTLELEEESIYVTLLDQVVPFKKLADTLGWCGHDGGKPAVSFFYAFIPEPQRSKIPACIAELRKYRIAA